jgi:DNA replicative helicase MCM subunit Mcm2 (Cdc46/Mcm family)
MLVPLFVQSFVMSILRRFVHQTPALLPSCAQIASLYADLRAQSAISGGVPIAVRHIESIMRMSEATARMNLRDYVRDDDIDFAIKVLLPSSCSYLPHSPLDRSC